MADAGATLLQLKKYGCWKSSSVAEGYYKRSRHGAIQNSNLINSSLASQRVFQSPRRSNRNQCGRRILSAFDEEMEDEDPMDVDDVEDFGLSQYAFSGQSQSSNRSNSNRNRPVVPSNSARNGQFQGCTFTGAVTFELSQ